MLDEDDNNDHKDVMIMITIAEIMMTTKLKEIMIMTMITKLMTTTPMITKVTVTITITKTITDMVMTMDMATMMEMVTFCRHHYRLMLLSTNVVSKQILLNFIKARFSSSLSVHFCLNVLFLC